MIGPSRPAPAGLPFELAPGVDEDVLHDAGALICGPVPRVLEVSADDYYRAPGMHFDRLYANWLADRP